MEEAGAGAARCVPSRLIAHELLVNLNTYRRPYVVEAMTHGEPWSGRRPTTTPPGGDGSRPSSRNLPSSLRPPMRPHPAGGGRGAGASSWPSSMPSSTRTRSPSSDRPALQRKQHRTRWRAKCAPGGMPPRSSGAPADLQGPRARLSPRPAPRRSVAPPRARSRIASGASAFTRKSTPFLEMLTVGPAVTAARSIGLSLRCRDAPRRMLAAVAACAIVTAVPADGQGHVLSKPRAQAAAKSAAARLAGKRSRRCLPAPGTRGRCASAGPGMGSCAPTVRGRTACDLAELAAGRPLGAVLPDHRQIPVRRLEPPARDRGASAGGRHRRILRLGALLAGALLARCSCSPRAVGASRSAGRSSPICSPALPRRARSARRSWSTSALAQPTEAHLRQESPSACGPGRRGCAAAASTASSRRSTRPSSGYRILIMPGVYKEQPSRNVPVRAPDSRRARTTTSTVEGLTARRRRPPARRSNDKPERANRNYAIKCPNSKNLIAVIGDTRPEHNPRRRSCPSASSCATCRSRARASDPEDVLIVGDRSKIDVLRIDRANGIYLRNFTIEQAAFNDVDLVEVDGFRVSHVVARYAQNYGILSFTATHGLYDHDVAYSNGDSGLYPGSTMKGCVDRRRRSTRNTYGTCEPDRLRQPVDRDPQLRQLRQHARLLGHRGQLDLRPRQQVPRQRHRPDDRLVRLRPSRACRRSASAGSTTRSTRTTSTCSPPTPGLLHRHAVREAQEEIVCPQFQTRGRHRRADRRRQPRPAARQLHLRQLAPGRACSPCRRRSAATTTRAPAGHVEPEPLHGQHHGHAPDGADAQRHGLPLGRGRQGQLLGGQQDAVGRPSEPPSLPACPGLGGLPPRTRRSVAARSRAPPGTPATRAPRLRLVRHAAEAAVRRRAAVAAAAPSWRWRAAAAVRETGTARAWSGRGAAPVPGHPPAVSDRILTGTVENRSKRSLHIVAADIRGATSTARRCAATPSSSTPTRTALRRLPEAEAPAPDEVSRLGLVARTRRGR